MSRDYLVEGRTFEEAFGFETSFYCTHPITFENCSFKEGISFSHLKAGKLDIEFSNCQFFNDDGIVVSDSKMLRLSLTNCSVKSIRLENSEILDILISDSEILDLLQLVNLKSTYTLLKNKKKDLVINQIRLNSQELEEFEIDSASHIKTIKLFAFHRAEINSSADEISVYEGDFEQMNLGLTSLDKSKRNSRIGELKIIDIKQQGIIRVEETFISSLKFDRIDATNGTYFFNETVVGDTHIESCIFSKFYCNQLFFVNDPMILKSDVSSFDLNNLGWERGKKLKSVEDFKSIPLFYWLRRKSLKKRELHFDADDLVELRDQKDTYRQLKKASQANKNHIDALQFHANEMRTYWKEVRITGNISFADRVLIFLDRWVSNFGQNWFLPLLWMFVFALLFYSCILNWNYFSNNWSGGKEFGQFWVMFNPVHKTPEYINTGAGHFTEFVMRIFTGYFVYHFIKASRKFGKV